jgi:hypothetical protein
MLGLGQFWKGSNVSDTGGSVTASGTQTQNGSALVAIISCISSDSITPTAPVTNGVTWTLVQQSGNRAFIYAIPQGAGPLNTLTISYTGGTGGPVNLEVLEITTTALAVAIDTTASPHTTTGTATLTTNSLIDNASSIFLLAAYSQEAVGTTSPSFSSPTNSFALAGSQNGNTDGTEALNSAAYFLVVSNNVAGTSYSTQVTSTKTTAAIEQLVSFSESQIIQSQSQLYKAKTRRRQTKVPSRRKRKGFVTPGALLPPTPLIPQRRKKRPPPKPPRRKKQRGFNARFLTLIGGPPTLTVLERLQATLLVKEELQATSLVKEALSATLTVQERLKATDLVSERLNASDIILEAL